jgi:hypothetical protein
MYTYPRKALFNTFSDNTMMPLPPQLCCCFLVFLFDLLPMLVWPMIIAVKFSSHSSSIHIVAKIPTSVIATKIHRLLRTANNTTCLPPWPLSTLHQLWVNNNNNNSTIYRLTEGYSKTLPERPIVPKGLYPHPDLLTLWTSNRICAFKNKEFNTCHFANTLGCIQ